MHLFTESKFNLFQDGYLFRIRLAHRKEISLAKECVTPQGLLVLKDNAKSEKLQQDIIYLPRLTSMLHG